jgi:hypothetical protein
MTKRFFGTLAIAATLLGIEAASLRTLQASERKDPPVVGVNVDGVLYSREEYAAHFADLDLHWVVDDEARAQGVLIAFTTEANRDAALAANSTGGGKALAVDSSYQVCLNKDGGTPCRTYSTSVDNVGSDFNDKITSVYTRDRAIILYEHAGRTGCSLFVQAHKAIGNLSNHDFCGLFTGSWNDKTSSIGLEG